MVGQFVVMESSLMVITDDWEIDTKELNSIVIIFRSFGLKLPFC